MDTLNLNSIAILIDADNAQLSILKAVFDEISKYGRIIVKKAYGDWKNPSLKNWEDELKQLAIKPEQQFAYTKGKNATDIALVIDAMDLLYTKNYDAFAIVCSDADYTPLAIRLRETGAYIFGIGEEKTPTAFRNACDDFILTSRLSNGNTEKVDPINDQKITEIHSLLKAASEAFQDDDGWVTVSNAGSYIKRARPDFDLKVYGFKKMSDLLIHYKDKYETKKPRTGSVAYRIKKSPRAKTNSASKG